MKFASKGFLAISITFLILGCKARTMTSLDPFYARLDAVSKEQWNVLSQKKIFFGHKSVGVNIIDGLQDVMKARPYIRLNVLESSDPVDFSGPVFAHASIGKNFDPNSKIDSFLEIMESGVGQSVDIAFFKFCFVDIGHLTDLEALFKNYVEAIEQLEAEFPNVKIITFTAPLVSKPVGLKAGLKKLLGRLPWYDTDHVQRNGYNTMLRERFKESLFDIAAFESKVSDTKRAAITKDGKEYDILYRGYTDDGGHLNSLGRQIVAIELLVFLAHHI